MIEIFKNGGPVMYPLLLCSLVSISVIIDLAFCWGVVGMKRNGILLNEGL